MYILTAREFQIELQPNLQNVLSVQFFFAVNKESMHQADTIR